MESNWNELLGKKGSWVGSQAELLTIKRESSSMPES